ncbi:MAG: S24/S26 family peptidase [Christensenellales bacterium]
MLYRTGLLKKEWRYAYYENPSSLRTSLALGVFQGMLAFAIFFVLQTLRQSVLSDTVPYFMQTSYFSTAFLYLMVSYIAMTAYFIAKLPDISYAEVYGNRWYTMVHLGYSVFPMVLAKMLAQLVYALFVYAIGFLVTLALTSFLKAPFIPSYLVSQFIVGAVNVTMLLLFTLTVSLATRDLYNARYLLGFAALALFLLQLLTGYFSLITDREAMRDTANLLFADGGAYTISIVAIIAVCIGYCLLRATHVARLYNAPIVRTAPKIDETWGEGARIVVRTQSKNRQVLRAAKLLAKAYTPTKRSSALSVIITVSLTAVVLFMLLINGALLAFNYASPVRETSVMGFIPYIFQSSTMEPTIKYNDIAFFEKIDRFVQINVGDVILFKDVMGEVQVRRANDIFEDEETGEMRIDCDIDHYPEDAIPDVLKTQTTVDAVYGRLVGVNRGLGAVVLFANTVVGRMMFLIVPTILIFYSGQIRRFFDKLGRGHR